MKNTLTALFLSLALSTACSESSEVATSELELSPCCSSAMQLVATMPECCQEGIQVAGQLTGCCETGLLDETADADRPECCTKTKGILEDFKPCCRTVVLTGETGPCCETMPEALKAGA